MDPVNGLSQALSILRQRLSEQNRTTAGRKGRPAITASHTASPATKEEVKRKIGERIRGIPEGKDKQRKSAQAFVEIVLAWELGDEVLNDPKFADITNEVVNTLLEDPASMAQIQTLLRSLE